MSRVVPAPYAVPSRRVFSVDFITRASVIFRVPPKVLKGSARDAETCRARFAVMVAMRQSGMSTPAIGRRLGNRDHTTIMSGLARADVLMRAEPDYALLCRAVMA